MIRSLRADEEVPDAAPRRYQDGRGYIRLRWKIGPALYAEEYEHRIVTGRPDAEVHHLNGDKGDNRRENLLVLSKEAHARLHAIRDDLHMRFKGRTRERQYGPYRSRDEMEKAGRAAAHREALQAQVAEMARLYAAGLSTTEAGACVGIAASNVSRRLRAAGVEMRPRDKAFYLPPIDRGAVGSMHAEGVRAAEMCRRLGVGRTRLYQVLDELGLPRFGPGNPRLAKAPAAEPVMYASEDGGVTMWLEADGGLTQDAPVGAA